MNKPLISPLEMFHIRGSVRTVTVLGSGRPERLIPERPDIGWSASDLVFIAPDAKEGQDVGWLVDAVNFAANQCSKDGLIYALVPVGKRTLVERALRGVGFNVNLWVAHLPDWTANRYLLTLRPEAVQYALNNMLPTAGWKRLIAGGLLRFPGGPPFIGRLLNGVGMAAYRNKGVNLFGWLREENQASAVQTSVSMQVSQKAQNGSIMMALIQPGQSLPSSMVKVTWFRSARSSARAEADHLRSLGPKAEAAGARIPKVIRFDQSDSRSVLETTALPGSLAAARLIRSPGQLKDIIQALSTWLAGWNKATISYEELTLAGREEFLYQPLGTAGERLGDVDDYRTWLGKLMDQITAPVPFVAAHRDLTMWNVLVADPMRIGIVDWEAATARSFLFTDYFYLLVDGAAIASRKSRLEALKSCFSPQGENWNWVNPALLEAARTFQAPIGIIDLSLHACFLHHAANELLNNAETNDRPFQEIVLWLAQSHFSIERYLYS